MNIQYGNNSLDANEQLALDFSKQSYLNTDERTNVGDYEYDPTLSNYDTAVWHDRKNKRTHVSSRMHLLSHDC